MTDLAAFGFAVDSSQIETANKRLETFSQSGKSAQTSADVLVAAAARLGISVEELQRRLAAANDNLNKNAEMSMKLADATKQASAANDNFSNSMRTASGATSEAGRGFFGTIEHVLNLTGHLKLLAVAAYALSPAFRGIVNSGIRTFLLDILPITGLASAAMTRLSSAASTLLSVFMRIGPPILTAVVAFSLLNAVWDKGSALLDKYANSLRSLYSEDTATNLQKLTKFQGEAGDIITADQIARATELGVRLQDAGFIINKFLNTSVIDFTNLSLRLQAVWVAIVEAIARAAQLISSIPIGKLAEVAARSTVGGAVVGGIKFAADTLSPDTSKQDSLQAARDRLSAVMGVSALTSEALNRTKMSVNELGKEFDIGGSFVARYSDAIKKLADGVRDTDTWDRASKSIERHTASLIANSSSVGKDINFQEQLRVETQLLNATKGGLNAVTDEQIDKYAELRKTMEVGEAVMQAGIRLDKDRIETMKDLGERAADAKEKFAQLNFAISNQKAIDADKIATRALTAFSPSQKGDIAEAQKRLELQNDLVKGIATQEQVDERATSARKLAIQSEVIQLNEVKRARELAAKQTVDSAKLEIDSIGKTVGQQAELRANLQARQQLEQESSQRRTAFDEAEYARLKKLNEELGKQVQLNAIAAANDNIKFGASTSLLSQEDVQIATQLRNIYPDVATALGSVQAAGIQTNRTLSNLSSTISNNLVTGLADILDGTKSISQGFTDMSKSVVRAIEEMIIKLYIIIPLMRALQSAASSMFGLGGGGGSAMGNPTQIGSLYHSGGIVGSEPTAMRAVNDNVFHHAPRLHGGLMPDEFPAILQKGEGVFTKGQMAAMGSPNITVNLIEDSSRAGQTETKKRDDGGFDINAYVDSITAKNAANPGSATSMALDNRKRVASR